ncbi:hypothetical protein HDV00_003052 [Rhizophlyctis rosea]|nr:hypothetical protein HDV00_003052 [Rhizophlyctis rosea]
MKKPVVDSAPKRVTQIDFGVFSAQDAKKLAVLELHERDLYDTQQASRPPAKFGALDRRLGIADKNSICETCGENLQDCVGHYGVIRLVLPVYHIGYFKLMQTECACVLLPEKQRRSYLKQLRNPNLDGVRRKEVLKKLNVECKKVTICPHCAGLNGSVKKVGAMKIVHEKFKKKVKAVEAPYEEFRRTFENAVKLEPALKAHVSKAQEDFTPLSVLRLFERISNEDCELMGLDPARGRPELFLWNAIPVPPVCLRPSVGQENATNEDDITVLLSEIVEINTKMKELMMIGTQASMLLEHWDYLQLQCAMYVTADLPGVPPHMQGNLPKIKRGFCQRLKGKFGRFRGNLSGKRVDFSGRTVISPDPNLRIDQVAVPERVAKILTYPERVTAHNIEKLRKCVQNGTEKHPGAAYVVKSQDRKMFLKYGNRKKIADELAYGDVVERHLNDGDVVLFNRQPSLHKLSILAHYVKVRPWRTFRFNECVCAPYNADFDGDEMNLHVPQTEEARAEALLLMGTKSNLVTPKNGEPVIAATQDFITASYLLSHKDRFYDRTQFTQICSYMGDALMDIDIPPPTIFKPVRLWTGKQVFNVLLRPKQDSTMFINLETKCKNFEKDVLTTRYKKKYIRIRNTPQAEEVEREYGPYHPSFCRADNWLVIYNSELMSGAVDKAIIGDGNKNSMFYTVLRDYGPITAGECMNRVAKLSARWLANQGFSIGIDDVQPPAQLAKSKENAVQEGYDACDDTIRLSKEGKLPNQAGSTAEQTLEAKVSGILSKVREEAASACFRQLNKYNAPLIMALCGSKGSRLNVAQMVTCVGQQIISGKRIPNGFIDRSLPHFPRNSKVPAAKGFVRNSFYSGLTPSEFFFHAVSGREGLVDTAVKTAETGYMQRRLMKALEDLTAHYDSSVRNATGGVVQFTYGDDALDPASMEGENKPVVFQRNLQHCMALYNHPEDERLLPWEITELVKSELGKPRFEKALSHAYLQSLTDFVQKEVVKKLVNARKAHGLPACTEEDETTTIEEEQTANLKMKVTKQQILKFLDICHHKYMRAMIEPGTAVGAVGAQSIGEPGTQMTLKTFHFAGLASMNITLGVPRIKEIINASKTIATPIVTSELVSGKYNEIGKGPMEHQRFAAEVAARAVKARVEKTLLEDITEYVQEIIGPHECCLRFKFDIDAIRKLQLEINPDSVRHAILQAKKLKLDAAMVRFDGRDGVRVVVGDDRGDRAAMFHKLQSLKRSLPKVVVKGIPTANRAVINDIEKEKKLQLLVEGYGMKEVMGMDGIEGTQTKSNHTLEVFKVLGVEAARQTIIDEIGNVMSGHGLTIDTRHMMLLADLMTFKGEILGITRFGIAKMKDSVLMLASFEKTTDHLFEASFYGKRDHIDGVSECIIMGQPMEIGTGLFKLLQQTEQSVDDIVGGKKLLFHENVMRVAV